MLDHVSITVSNIDRAEAFYDAVFSALGMPKVVSEPNRLGYGERARPDNTDRTYLSIRIGEAGRVQGRHWAFKAESRAAVDAFHAAGLAAGGRDEGAPGLRPHYHESYYAAFLLDPDGNRIEAVCHLSE
jgi:catechol 2,3-dioxygenase-like lactoylglutathione lyase family enzyme